MSVPFERRLSILSQDKGLLLVKINLFEANWTHFDAKLLVITNVTWSNIDNWKSCSLLGSILDNSLVLSTSGATIFNNSVWFSTFSSEFNSVGSKQLQGLSIVTVGLIEVSNRVVTVISDSLSGLSGKKSEEGDLTVVVGAVSDVLSWAVVESVSTLHFTEVNMFVSVSSEVSTRVNISVGWADTGFLVVEVAESLDGISFTTTIWIDPVVVGLKDITSSFSSHVKIHTGSGWTLLVFTRWILHHIDSVRQLTDLNLHFRVAAHVMSFIIGRLIIWTLAV